MDRKLWEKTVAFHGHECPGLAIGFRACEAAQEKLKLSFSPDEEIVCVTENDACGVDAIQFVLGCTFGKGNLLYRDTGKMAYSFFNRKTGERVRLVLKPLARETTDRKARLEYLLQAPLAELFLFKEPSFPLPEKASLFASVVCEKCGEIAPEHKIRLSGGKKVCLDCFTDYTRGW